MARCATDRPACTRRGPGLQSPANLRQGHLTISNQVTPARPLAERRSEALRSVLASSGAERSTRRNRFRQAVVRGYAAKNTLAELRVRRVAHSLGLRFRLHRAQPPRQAGHRLSEVPPGGFRPRVLLASAPRLQEGENAEDQSGLLAEKIQKQYGSRQAGGRRDGFARMAGARLLGMRDLRC